MKSVIHVSNPPGRHWVGDGFPVHGMFAYNHGADTRSPFLVLDYVAPTEFTSNSGYRRGVGEHPHRGFETVTIVYAGEVEHRDSTGAGGTIGVGDVQWMTAGGGIIHEEFHSKEFSRTGGFLEIVQLWVNLPAKDKMTPAHYQAISSQQIPVVAVGKSVVRVIAGEYLGHKGPAVTYTPVNVWDVRVKGGETLELPQPDGWTLLLLVQAGTVQVNDDQPLHQGQLLTLSREGQGLRLEASSDARVLLMGGQPIEEPIVGYGPFVMNTEEEIRQAVSDFNNGKFGQMP